MRIVRSTDCLFLAVGIIWTWMAAAVGPASAQPLPLPTGGAGQTPESSSAAELPPDIDPQKVDSIIASMSDEQVRRLLIQELKKQATAVSATPTEKQPTGLAGFINHTRAMLRYLQARIEFLRSGVDLPDDQEVPDVFTYLGKGEKSQNPFLTIMSVVAVFAASLIIAWFFHLYTRGARQRIETASYSSWLGKLGGLSLRALLDTLTIVVFAAATLTIFYIFLERNMGQRVLVASYLAAFGIVGIFRLVSRFLLSPHASAIRVLPLQDEAAVYLHQWLTAIVFVGAFGLLTCGIFRLAGTSEARHFVMVSGVSVLMGLMLACMIIIKRKQVATLLIKGHAEDSLRARLARSWHHFAIFGVFVLVASSILNRLLYGSGEHLGIKTLLLVALYFLLDWLLSQALEFAFGLAKKPEKLSSAIVEAGAKLHAAAHHGDMEAAADEEPGETEAGAAAETQPSKAEKPIETEAQARAAAPAAMAVAADPGAATQSATQSDRPTADAEAQPRTAGAAPPAAVAGGAAVAQGGSTDEETDEEPEEKQTETAAEPPGIDRMKHVLRGGLHFTLGALIFFWIMNVWGVTLPVGKAVADAAFDILVTLLVCYVAWELINAAIQRRLVEEMPEEDEEMEEGGAGGSRVGTLLLLLRKFMLAVMVILLTMIVLSRLGVNIGPLIAGAGVIGLAIGFGAQTLVRDIISGVFFLIDDAFRVGDYIQAGSSKGMVQQISLRSFKLRHPRGMLYTIPFGDVGMVTNFSRDYIITKLDFRVKYDTDVEKVRKIIKKKVYYPIRDNEELGPKLLAPIKSQGVREMQDSAMIMRVKFKTQPGEQFVLRKEVYRLMSEAFKEEGIEFAHRNVTVYIPPEPSGQEGQNGTERQQRIAQAAAAAGAAIAQKEEEEEEKARQQTK